MKDITKVYRSVFGLIFLFTKVSLFAAQECQDGLAPEGDKVCCICLDSLESFIVTTLPCHKSHVYHSDCIDTWFSQRKEDDLEDSCPECRSEFGALPLSRNAYFRFKYWCMKQQLLLTRRKLREKKEDCLFAQNLWQELEGENALLKVNNYYLKKQIKSLEKQRQQSNARCQKKIETLQNCLKKKKTVWFPRPLKGKNEKEVFRFPLRHKRRK